MLIGLSGKLKSGKDTTFNIIKELRPDAEKISFATKLKESAAAALGITIEELDYLKNDEHYKFVLHPQAFGGVYFSVREFLQRLGTEAGRDVFGENFLADIALPSNTNHSNRFIVVTDMRFPNEIDRVIELGGFTVRINRKTITNYGNHRSEQDMPDELFDWELNSDGSLEDLKTNVKKMLTTFEEAQ